MTTAYRIVQETPTEQPPGFTVPEWRDRFPWLVQGTTGAGGPEAPFDLGVFGLASPSGSVTARWEALREATGMQSSVVARQVHGAAVRLHRSGPPGMMLSEPCDGHATGAPGLLLAVTVADCVPVSLVDPVRRTVALLHAGWRGAAAGVLEQGLAVLTDRMGSAPDNVLLHLGPSICGACYEVGPEVFDALGLDVPGTPGLLDLRTALADRAVEAGARPDAITLSALCTRCGPGLFSHRGGDVGRQVGYLGVRA